MARADNRARDLYARLGLGDPPIDLDEVARTLGIVVVREGTTANLLGMLLRRAGQVAIGLNPNRSPLAQRFTLAHLLGHHQLHRDRSVLFDVVDQLHHEDLRHFPTDREEAEANRFAVALLAPEPQVRKAARDAEWSTGVQLVGILAERFEVNPAVMSYRLISLGILVDC